MNRAILWEITASTNPVQKAAVIRALEDQGWLFDPDELVIKKDALYIVRSYERNADWVKRLVAQGAVERKFERYNVYFAPVTDQGGPPAGPACR